MMVVIKKVAANRIGHATTVIAAAIKAPTARAVVYIGITILIEILICCTKPAISSDVSAEKASMTKKCMTALTLVYSGMTTVRGEVVATTISAIWGVNQLIKNIISTAISKGKITAHRRPFLIKVRQVFAYTTVVLRYVIVKACTGTLANAIIREMINPEVAALISIIGELCIPLN